VKTFPAGARAAVFMPNVGLVVKFYFIRRFCFSPSARFAKTFLRREHFQWVPGSAGTGMNYLPPVSRPPRPSGHFLAPSGALLATKTVFLARFVSFLRGALRARAMPPQNSMATRVVSA
jgi:hypothetical protein